MLEQQQVCLRQLGGRRAAEVQFGRFLANAKVTPEKILAGAYARTAHAAAGRHVLAIQDTTELNYQAHRARVRGLGTVGNGVDAGLFLHPLLALDADDGTCLGLAHLHHWNRTQKASADYKKLPIEDKESFRWLQTAQAGQKVLSQARTVTIVADRESDIPAQGVYSFTVPARPGKRSAHVAQVAVRTMQLTQARDGAGTAQASEVFEAQERMVLRKLQPTLEGKTAKQKNPHPPGSLAQAAWVIARLGGWKGYASEAKPGSITMRNGLLQLALICRGWLLASGDVCID